MNSIYQLVKCLRAKCQYYYRVAKVKFCYCSSYKLFFSGSEKADPLLRFQYVGSNLSFHYLCDFVIRDIKIVVYLESLLKINFNLVSDFLSK